jgi:hypothetical protein
LVERVVAGPSAVSRLAADERRYRGEYAALKRELYAMYAENRERYTESKGPFIKAALRQAEKEMSATVAPQNDNQWDGD